MGLRTWAIFATVNWLVTGRGPDRYHAEARGSGFENGCRLLCRLIRWQDGTGTAAATHVEAVIPVENGDGRAASALLRTLCCAPPDSSAGAGGSATPRPSVPAPLPQEWCAGAGSDPRARVSLRVSEAGVKVRESTQVVVELFQHPAVAKGGRSRPRRLALRLLRMSMKKPFATQTNAVYNALANDKV